MAPGVGGPKRARPQWGKRMLYAVMSAGILFGLTALLVCGIGFLGGWALLGGSAFVMALHRFWLVLPGWLRIIATTGLILGGGLFAVLSAVMLHGGWLVRPAGDLTYTLIVLGAQVEGDRPSLMLEKRLKTALSYLEAHPDAVVVVSGGRGANEARTEASVMKEWLVASGIDPARIFEEIKAGNTEQNIAYSVETLRENALPDNLILVSDGFHLARARLWAERAGFSAVALPAPTPFWLLPAYWVREMAAYAVAWGKN